MDFGENRKVNKIRKRHLTKWNLIWKMQISTKKNFSNSNPSSRTSIIFNLTSLIEIFFSNLRKCDGTGEEDEKKVRDRQIA